MKRIVRVKSKPKRIVRVKSKDQKIRGKAALSFFEEKFPNFGVDRFGIKWPILVHKNEKPTYATVIVKFTITPKKTSSLHF